MTEAQLQANIIEFAELSGWRCYHTYDSRRSHAGFPDLVLLRPPRLIFAELKAEKGRVRTEQQEWLSELTQIPSAIEVYLWRPSDWDSIVQTLRRSY